MTCSPPPWDPAELREKVECSSRASPWKTVMPPPLEKTPQSSTRERERRKPAAPETVGRTGKMRDGVGVLVGEV